MQGPLNVPMRGIGKARVDLLIELVDNLGGRVLGHTDADPEASLIAGTNSATAGISGSTSERVAEVTASARSLPVLIQ